MESIKEVLGDVEFKKHMELEGSGVPIEVIHFTFSRERVMEWLKDCRLEIMIEELPNHKHEMKCKECDHKSHIIQKVFEKLLGD